MIKATLKRKDGRISEVCVKGHAFYRDPGEDIVCSAVSAVVQTALSGLIKFCGKARVAYIIKDGYLFFTVPASSDEKENYRTEAITETMLEGLRDIEKGYKAFVKVEEI